MRPRRIAIIGGTGLDQLPTFTIDATHRLTTSYGEPSDVIAEGRLFDEPILFLPRHGSRHAIPPHRINYRANIAALHKLGVDTVMAVTAVGGISGETSPRTIVIPDQVIDYTYGREHTFADGVDGEVTHIDFTDPFDSRVRQQLIDAARRAEVFVIDHGVYGATQGPRLETAAEISRMARDGCTIVGMTAMPEAALARELGLCYANCSVVVNRAAGTGEEIISMDAIADNLRAAMGDLQRLIRAWLATEN